MYFGNKTINKEVQVGTADKKYLSMEASLS